ncbi:MAG: zinc ribbon domain-containing protein [Calditrichaeota bacterium]|nr:zinc ribbon domain-containing protein [Calditrichota bacterium]
MPTYEYQCLDCGHRVDYFQSMSEAPRRVCPVCRGWLTRLVSSGAGLIFKGSGFYITDYKHHHNNPTSSTANSTPASSDKPAAPTGAEKSAAKDNSTA